jgi:PKD repeat protein
MSDGGGPHAEELRMGARKFVAGLVVASGAWLALWSSVGHADIAMSGNPIWQVAGSYPTGVGWADIDGNGWLDLVVTRGLDVTSPPDVIYFNSEGELATTPGWTSDEQGPSDNVYLGDLNGDGYPDLTIAYLGLTSTGLPPEQHLIYFNNGGTPSTTADWRSAPGNAFSCDGGDVDGDGDIDIAFGQGDRLTNHYQHTVLYVNEGGAFDTIPGWESDSVYYATEVDFADVDLDGDLDLAMGAANFGVALFYNHGGVLEATPSWHSSGIQAGRQMAFGDVDGDGYPDLAVAGGHESFYLLRNQGGVLESTPSWSTGGTYTEPSSVAWADLDADGDLDLAAGGWYTPVGVFENDGGTLSQTLVWSYPTSAVQQIRCADFDEDGLVNTVESFAGDGSRTLYYLAHRPVHDMVSVELNGVALGPDVYCFDAMDAWLSLGVLPAASDTLTVTYTYSVDLDLAVTDWQCTRVFENQVLIPPYLIADFQAVPASGHAPLTVQFTDASLADPPATWWAWDFSNDGTVDSGDQNPIWVYAVPGHYSVGFEVSNGSGTDSLVREDYIRVFNGESALEFDGSDSRVTCPSSASLSMTEALTIEAWINPAGWGEAGAGGYGRVVDKDRFALYLNGQASTFAPHSLVLVLKNETGPPSISWTPDSTISLAKWQHVAGTYDAATGEARLCIDGVGQTVSQTNAPSGPLKDHSAFDLQIGNSGALSCTFDGIVDEVRVWNLARSPADIAAWMKQPLVGDEEGLAGYWRMNEGGGSVLSDGSGNGNDGQIHEAEWIEGYEPSTATDGDREGIGAVPTSVSFIASSSPNPFSGVTAIQYSLPRAADVDLSIYDLSGRLVRKLQTGQQPQGIRLAEWDGTETDRSPAQSGTYLCRLKAGGVTHTRRLVLVR